MIVPRAIGIDLGTTNSCMAVMMGKDPVVIPNAEGGRTTPSVVALAKSGERLVGQAAKRQAIVNPEQTIRSVKRLMGRKIDDPVVAEARRRVPYRLTAAPNGDVRIVLGDREYTPPEISAMILQKLKMDAEAYLGEPVTEAVITVPASFNDSQRQATKDAGTIAGLNVLRIMNEPTAAALAYGLTKRHDEVIAIYDLGGGTFDISILELGGGVFEVKATSGDTFLGGDDFDQRIIEWLCQEFVRAEGVDLQRDRLALQRLKEAAEKAKAELSTVLQTEINLPFITATPAGPKHLVMTLTRAQLERLVVDLVERSLEPCRQALADAGIRAEQIDAVLLVGGQTRMPLVQEMVRRFFGKEPQRGLNPDEVVAMGAAIQAGVLKGEVGDVLLLDVTPLTLAIETFGGVATPLIPRNTTIPTRKTEIFTTARDNQTSVEIHVLQGERPLAAENKTLGRFILDGIPPAPRGVPQIEVTFDIDANGILNVSARDRGTGREQQLRITASSGLSKEEIARLVREAELHAEEDRRRRAEVELRNQADALLYQADRLLREHGDQVPADVKAIVSERLTALRRALDEQQIETIRWALTGLSEAIQRISQALQVSDGKGSRPAEKLPQDGRIDSYQGRGFSRS